MESAAVEPGPRALEDPAARARSVPSATRVRAEGLVGLAPDDRIILCTPIPLWSLREKMTHRGEETELRAIEDFVAAVVPSHASVPVYLAGDSHFYAHYVQECGGSGPSTDDEPVHHIANLWRWAGRSAYSTSPAS